MPLAIGLMSGTSADGVTAALVRLSPRFVSVLRLRTYPYPQNLREKILGARDLKTPELSRLNWEIGEAFADAALKIKGRERVSAIGSHGQTVHHDPSGSVPNTLQIGEAALIAEKTRTSVVCDFRPRDIAAGGQGAPLVPAFDAFLFSKGPLRAVQNIGGIANATFVRGGRVLSAFDTGPGNCLLDAAVRLATGGRAAMDRDGRWASRGRADQKMASKLLKNPYFGRRPPKSLDRRSFDEELICGQFGHISKRRLPDVLATLSLFTARSIALACRRFSPGPVSEMVISGGGALNPHLVKLLRREIAPVPLASSARYGIPPMAKEAACFAWLAHRTLQGRAGNSPTATGATGPRVLGKIVPA